MKQVLNNTKSLSQLHNIMIVKSDTNRFYELVFEVLFDAGVKMSLKWCQTLVQNGTIIKAADHSKLPMYYLKASSVNGMMQKHDGTWYKPCNDTSKTH